MKTKEKEILEALVPENTEINKGKRKRRSRRLGAINYMMHSNFRNPFSLRFPS
jgi:hypothetical protein